jgi:ankyrin repeat protein
MDETALERCVSRLPLGGPTPAAITENLFRLAIKAADGATLRIILGSGFDPSDQVCYNAFDFDRKLTPLQYACKVRSTEIVRLLLEAGADVSSTLDPGQSVLECAVSYAAYPHESDLHQTELIQILLDAGAKADTEHGAHALQIAVRAHHINIVALLIHAGADVSSTTDLGKSVLECAIGVSYGGRCREMDIVQTKLIRILLDAGAKADTEHGAHALHRATEQHHFKTVALLINAGADINSTLGPKASVLECAVRFSHMGNLHKRDIVQTELIRILLDAGAKADTEHGAYALYMAAKAHHVKTVALLIDAGADVNFKDFNGRSPLFEFVQTSEDTPCSLYEDVVAIIRKLIQAGADVQATASSDDYPEQEPEAVLTAAIYSSRVEIIQLLLDGGAVVTECAFIAAFSFQKEEEDSTDEDNTCTRESCVADMVKLLLKFRARVTYSVIEVAVQWSSSEMVFLLLKSVDHGIEGSLGKTALITAIRYGKTNVIERLDSLGVSLTSTPHLKDAMAEAAGRGDVRVFQLLLSDQSRHRAAVISSLDSSLYPAIIKGQKDVTELLLEAGVEVNSKDWDLSSPPLLGAILQRDAHLAQRLLAAGAEANMYSLSHTRTLLPAAVAWGYRPLILDIISAGAEVNATQSNEAGGKTALTVAVEKRDVLTVQTLIEAGSDVNAPAALLLGLTALEAATRNNDIAMVDYLLGIGAHIDEGSLNAAVSVSVELMQLLLSARPIRCQRYPMGYGCSALQIAIQLKKLVMVETLLASGIGTNTIVHMLPWHYRAHAKEGVQHRFSRDPASAFGTAIETVEGKDHLIVRMLLASGADPNGILSRPSKKTALLAGIDQNNLSLVNDLIGAGADVNADLAVGISRTPLQRAAEKGRMDIVRTVLEHGADVNAPPFHRFGATALQFAAIGGYVGIAYLLLERGADVNAEPAKTGGRTALEGAAEHGRIDMLQLLLNAGALIVGPGAEQYEIARKLATRNVHIAARRLLESYHAQLSEGLAGWYPMAIDAGVLDDLQI